MNSNDISRRSFLKQGVALSAVSAIPSFWIPSKIHASAPRVSANDKVNLALIGIGNRGNEITKDFIKTGMCNIVALCDVDMGAPHTQEVISMFPNVPRFQDFRQMFDKMGGQIDAVTVAVPDHSHFPITMEAMAHGKHVYVEKPMARTFNEVELMMKGEKKYGVVTQMGNQGHSEGNYFQFKAWKEAGIIKDVTAITGHMNNVRRWHEWNPRINSYPVAEQLPATMDWDTWLGVTHEHAYNHDYHLGQWRCWYDFGMGVLGDWGAHILDTVHEFLDLGLPTEINPIYLKDHNPFFYPMSSTLQFKFPARGIMPAVDITWYDGLDNIPAVPEGYGVSEIDPNIPTVAGGKIQPAKLNPGKEIYTDTLTFKGGSHGSTLSIIPNEVAKDMASKLPDVPPSPSNHFANFLLSCMGKEKTRSPFSIAGPLSQVFCLGVLSQWLNSKIVFDRETRQITNNPVANQLLYGAVPRQGWEQYYKI
ncbi:Gfo/Idh/MocA family oxidoreductase [Parabacteroides sp. PF5-9]|uniref:Gfo/Idh/MocA family oxidoreductase n=1 Tax=Parabacteroides sp. PF5-9 TaxID=1742404 RepID=UPI0024739A93|nr:Gfo/Idh/MocA family oxidoreductase [Parabacteroides sp. PF5-9]MDH6358989.1 putative dehydrogenase [Parabacteroides sp. PF5-9]